MSRGPRVSVIIPAFRARATLPAALASVATCGLPPSEIEVVLAPDDGDTYADLPDHGLALTRCAHHHMATGAGPARNRAITAARGDFIAFLDADDTWAPGYLATLLPLAEQAGAAFGRTRIHYDEKTLLHLPGHQKAILCFEDFGHTGASFHPVTRRALAGPFCNRPSQDVLHAMEVLSLVGGRAPIGETAYHLSLDPQSATAQAAFADRVDAAYRAHIRAIEAGETRIATEHHAAAHAAFEAKARLNTAYMQAGSDRFFYQFMQDGLAGEACAHNGGLPA
ncbi:MAG: glycosyltransferase family 2 protein [Roseovarius sp.]|nr:glycosyltransferase family 2 protein [Roseovarius sp.]